MLNMSKTCKEVRSEHSRGKLTVVTHWWQPDNLDDESDDHQAGGGVLREAVNLRRWRHHLAEHHVDQQDSGRHAGGHGEQEIAPERVLKKPMLLTVYCITITSTITSPEA